MHHTLTEWLTGGSFFLVFTIVGSVGLLINELVESLTQQKRNRK